MTDRNPSVDGFMRKNKQWAEPMEALREIALGRGLVEDMKWRQPCYTSGGKNIVIIGAYKDHARLGFFKGELLDDPNGLLEPVGPNSRSAKAAKFATAAEVKKHAPAIRKLIDQMVKLEAAGAKVERKPADDPIAPAELTDRLKHDAAFKTSWQALTPGRRRAWTIHFSSAKKSETRTSRIEAARPKIEAGKGWNER